MNADHVMIDLETGDTASTAAIVSIGAVVFAGPHAGPTFYQAVDITSSSAAGLTISDGTMAWWAKQSEQARAVFTDPDRLPLTAALGELAAFLGLPDVRIWGNGASFDNAILANAYNRIGAPLPWKFWNDRCYRTVAAGIQARREQMGTHHNALDDAISQAEHLLQHAPGAIV